MEQLGQGVIAAYKEETGGYAVVPAVATGYKRIRFSRSPGMSMTMADINPGEVRDDGQSTNPRKGSKTITGSFGGAVYQGAWDDFFMYALRADPWASGRLIMPAADPVEHSITIEQYYKQKDGSKQFVGCRSSGFTFRSAPDAEVALEFPFVGADMNILSGAGAPGYSGALTTNVKPALTSVDAAILIDGIAAVDLSGIEFTLDNRAAGRAVVGSRVTNNVFPNNATLRGRLTGTSADFVREQAYIGEDNFAIQITLSEPGGGTGTVVFTLPFAKFIGFEEALGEEGALLSTIPFSAGTDESGGGNPRTMIIIDTTV